ncbi:hypothetical protein [Leptospira mtsangambouensis]|uniref:hypothetical protein n=1 Tax=Leptospira mtsangambouensis TaxID=2484912 RepID=UPI001EEAA45B|nr:hypothetical protein [Leptospira mtsangambouensis]MCG6142766.1 hypothetical protein [Leptospira mtsangambouensis]
MPESVYIDESHILIENKCIYYSMGATIIGDRDVEPVSNHLENLVKNAEFNPYFDSIKLNDLFKIGFHYAKDHREIKNLLLEYINFASFESYIDFSHSMNTKFEDTEYKPLLYSIFKILISKYDISTIFIETRHSNLEREANDLLTQAINSMGSVTKIKHYNKPNIVIVNKTPRSPICITDYILGIFNNILHIDTGRAEFRDLRKILNKLRRINDHSCKKIFYRGDPFPLDFFKNHRK